SSADELSFTKILLGSSGDLLSSSVDELSSSADELSFVNNLLSSSPDELSKILVKLSFAKVLLSKSQKIFTLSASLLYSCVGNIRFPNPVNRKPLRKFRISRHKTKQYRRQIFMGRRNRLSKKILQEDRDAYAAM